MLLIARVLYAAVLLSVMSAFPRPAADRHAEAPRATGSEPSVPPRWMPRAEAEEPAGTADRPGIARNPADFAIPRIRR